MHELYEAASRLYMSGVSNAFELSPRQIIWFSHVHAQKEKQIMITSAIASRIAQAESKSFDKLMKGLKDE